jgi:phospholipid transport system substrate-binding protein
MKRRFLGQLLASLTLAAMGLALTGGARAADEAPDVMIKRLSEDVIGAIKADKTLQTGDISRVIALVDSKIMPNVNFQRMTASAVGPAWRQATPEQQKRCRTNSRPAGAHLRGRAGAGERPDHLGQASACRCGRHKKCMVRTEVRGRGDPIQLDYRLEKTPGQGAGWKIFNLNVLGVWLVETYRSQFAQEINAKGVDGLIATLSARNKSNSAKKG